MHFENAYKFLKQTFSINFDINITFKLRYLTKVKIGSSRKEPTLKKANIVTVNIQNILLFLSFYLPFFVGLDYLEHNKRDYLGMVRIFLEWIFFSILVWYLLSVCKSILIFLSSYFLSFFEGGWICWSA